MQLAKALFFRLLFGCLSLLFISFVTFVASENAPGDPALRLAGEKASQETIQRIRVSLGLDQPWPTRYVRYISGAVRGEFGTSYYNTKEPVRDILARDLPMTVRLALSAIALASLFGIVLGTLSGVFENAWQDRLILAFSTLGVTLPNFVLGPLFVYYFALKLDRLPTTWSTERVLPDWMYLVMPVTILAMRPAAMLTRLTRASMVETLKQEFIRTATAKGVPRGRVILKHALRNAILPVVTAIGTSTGYLLTGSFVVETMFILPGIGRETIEAIQQNNSPVVQACILVTGFLFVMMNLLVDLVLPVLDPRIRESQI